MRILKLAAVLILWAASFILNEVALRSLAPLSVAAARWTVTALVLLAWLAWRGEMARFAAALRTDGRGLLAVALFGVPLLYGLQISGQARTTAMNTGLLANTVPVFTALLALVWLRQRLHWTGWAGIALALVGAWIISAGGVRVQINQTTALGDLLVLLSSLAGALYFVLGSRWLRTYPPLLVTAAVAVLGAAMLLPLALWTDTGSVWTWPAALAVLALGLGPGLLANLWWWETVAWLGAPRAAVYIYLIPLLTMLLAALLLHEQLAPTQALGAVLLLGGVWLAERT